MGISIARHIGYFLLPALQFQPKAQIFGHTQPWSLTIWLGTFGLVIRPTVQVSAEQQPGDAKCGWQIGLILASWVIVWCMGACHGYQVGWDKREEADNQ